MRQQRCAGGGGQGCQQAAANAGRKPCSACTVVAHTPLPAFAEKQALAICPLHHCGGGPVCHEQPHQGMLLVCLLTCRLSCVSSPSYLATGSLTSTALCCTKTPLCTVRRAYAWTVRQGMCKVVSSVPAHAAFSHPMRHVTAPSNTAALTAPVQGALHGAGCCFQHTHRPVWYAHTHAGSHALHSRLACSSCLVASRPRTGSRYPQCTTVSSALCCTCYSLTHAGRRAVKIISTITSCFSANYVQLWPQFLPDTPLLYTPVFDGRAVCYPSLSVLRDYLAWRQADTHINNQVGTQQALATPANALWLGWQCLRLLGLSRHASNLSCQPRRLVVVCCTSSRCRRLLRSASRTRLPRSWHAAA